MNKQESKDKKAEIQGWIALVVLIVLLSGIFQNNKTFLKAFDYTNLSGAFGTISVPNIQINEDGKIKLKDDGTIATTNYTFQGKGGTGAREGILVALSLMPLVSFAFGLIQLAQNMGAMKVAERAFRYILKPLYGIPGICGIAYVASFTSSDVGALMTRKMFEDGSITNDERTIFIAYQYPGTAVIGNTISTQAALLPCIALSTGPVILVLWLCKTIGANLVRVIIHLDSKKITREEA